MKFKEAVSFFTCMHSGKSLVPADVKGMFLCFPFVGLIIGLLVALIMGLAGVILPSCFLGIVGCIAWLVLTGGAHFQSLAKCGDKLFAPLSEKESNCALQNENAFEKNVDQQDGNIVTQEEVVAELAQETAKKTSCCTSKKHGHHFRVGVFGFITLFFVLAAKTVALSMLAMHYDIGYTYNDLLTLIFICIAAAMFARCVSFFATLMPTAREEGIVYELREPLYDFHYAVIAVLAFIICYFSGAKAIFMVAMCGIFTLYTLYVAKKRFGGLTDDVFACITEVSECLVLIAFCLSL